MLLPTKTMHVMVERVLWKMIPVQDCKLNTCCSLALLSQMIRNNRKAIKISN